MAKATSKAQAGLFGAVIGGRSTKAGKMSKASAKRGVKGVKVKNLPARAPKKKGKK